MSSSPSPTHRQRVKHWVASLVYGVIVFIIIGREGYFADPDTRMFAVGVAVACWVIGVVLIRRYCLDAVEPKKPSGR